MAKSDQKTTRKMLIDGLNEDLSREYQAIIAYVNYSQVLRGAQYMNIAKELEVHAKEELSHALKVANHIDYLGGMPSVFTEAGEDLGEGRRDAEIRSGERTRRRSGNIGAASGKRDELNEFAIAESIREILLDEQDHLIALATALGIDPPDAGIAD